MYESKMRCVLLSAVATAALVPLQGSAIDLISTNITNAAGNCQVTEPSQMANVKVKALALDNVGASGSVWVTCGLTSDESALGITGLRISLHNQNTLPATINCTAVVGTSASPAKYYAKSVGIGPGAENKIDWTAIADGGGIVFAHPASVTCLLPSGTGITTDQISYAVQLL